MTAYLQSKQILPLALHDTINNQAIQYLHVACKLKHTGIPSMMLFDTIIVELSPSIYSTPNKLQKKMSVFNVGKGPQMFIQSHTLHIHRAMCSR